MGKLIRLVVVVIGIALLSSPVFADEGEYDCTQVTEIPFRECRALIAIYDSLDGDNWEQGYTWFADYQPCSWSYIECTDGHVTTLTLDNTGVRGQIPWQITWLTSLSYLDLDYSQIYTPIPPFLGRMSSLRTLSLTLAGFHGRVPESLGNLADLQSLKIDENSGLYGPLPKSLVRIPNLYTFYFSQYTALCEPPHPVFQAWLDSIPNVSEGPLCPTGVN